MSNKNYFSLLVNEIEESEHGLLLKGIVHGSLQVYENCFLFNTTLKIFPVSIDEILKDSRSVDKVEEGEEVQLRLLNIDKGDVARFSALSSQAPQTTLDIKKDIENPYLLAVSYDYNLYYQDKAFMSLFVYLIVHGNYPVPVSMDKQPTQVSENQAKIEKDTNMKFLTLRRDQDGAAFIPLFTDKNTLSIDKLPESYRKGGLVMSFQDLVKFGMNADGLLLNPFGPKTIPLPKKFLQSILDNEAYQKEFKNKGKLKQVKGKKGKKLFFSIVEDNEETKLLKETLIAFARIHSQITRIDLLLQKDEDDDEMYLVVLQAPTSQQKDFYGQLNTALKPYCNKVSKLGFVDYAKASHLHEFLSKNAPIWPPLA